MCCAFVVALLIEEEKPELGEGGCDASTQASFSMLRYWAQRDNDAVRHLCCCPTFLVAVAGPWLAVMGAVTTDKCVVQRLTDFIWVGNSSILNDAYCRRVARILHSLSRSLGHLREYYVALAPQNKPTPSRFFPSTDSFLSNDGITPAHFEYLEALERDAACVTFLCKTLEDHPRTIVAKFAQTYCHEAHKLLAHSGMAPELLCCGSVGQSTDAPSYGPLMIVMDYVDGKTVAQLQHTELPANFAEQVTSILSILHVGGFVYGDLRPPNIMVTKEKKVKLIDFDWAGKAGDAKYPIHLATNIIWPAGVEALCNIERDHDLQMLRCLID
ncbi:hypothetical protein B0H10DRAFT_2164039 [Mycena sp. CBHHK59/15]|nr:hypothetical protein B0H10DRAFT_2164039 [Mycena sp. CBHHK59/15]